MHPGQVASPLQCIKETHRKTMHTQTQAYSKGNLEILIKLPVMFSDWEEAEVPEGNSRMQKGNMQTPYTPNVTFVLGN